MPFDLPGTTGLFWRKQERVHKRSADQNEPSDGVAHFFQVFFIFGGALVGLARVHLTALGKGCHLVGHPHWALGFLLAAELGLMWFLWNSFPRMRGLLGLLLVLGLSYVQWKLYGHWVAPDARCVPAA